MSKKPSATLLGAFIVGAVAITAAGLILFGKVSFFTEQPRYVVYFPGTVQGLTAGAPVFFRGATIGTVLDLQVHYFPEKQKVLIPVVIELDRNLVHGLNPPSGTFDTMQKRILEIGMRAQLVSQSFVTGQKAVALDFYPDKQEVHLTALRSKYPEIPSLANPLDQLSQKLEKLPLEDITKLLQESLNGIASLVNSDDTKDMVKSASSALKESEKLVADLRNDLKPIIRNFDELLVDLKTRVKNSKSDEIAANLDSALERMNHFLVSANGLIGPGTPADRSLREIADSAREFRVLIEYLQRHPESLVKGKAGGSR